MSSGLSTGWAIAFGIGTPVISFGAAWLGGWLGRVTAKETHARQRREETMRLFRWAADMAVADDVRKRAAGISALDALETAGLFEPDDFVLLDAVTNAIAALELSAYDETQALEGGDDDDGSSQEAT